jgi:protein-S-isoprenylcysteine O-methyltransferase Ste14
MYSFLFKRGFILPVTVTGVVPLTLVLTTGAWRELHPAWLIPGALLYLVGMSLLVVTTGLFARHHGSLAPWNPPTEMVVVGPYRHLRNPMISGVYSMLIGEALAFSSPWIAGWALLFITGMSSHIAFQEEPLLRKRFGDAYAKYCKQVPRWLPRVTPYRNGHA